MPKAKLTKRTVETLGVLFGKLLGHTQIQTTARYAHLASDPMKKAREQDFRSIGFSPVRKARHI